jgi:hypothetical protein
VSIERFRRQRAVDIKVAGSYVLPNWYDPQGKLRTFACRTTRVSPFRMIMDVPVVGKIGDSLTSYFQDFGNFEGEISDTVNGGFLLELKMTRAMRAKFADKLVWLEKKHKNAAIIDARKDARFIPKSPHSRVTLADGSVYPCLIIDVSVRHCRVIGSPAAGRNATRRRRLRRPRHPAFAERFRREVRQEAGPRRTQQFADEGSAVLRSPTSFLRTQEPITPSVSDDRRRLPHCLK